MPLSTNYNTTGAIAELNSAERIWFLAWSGENITTSCALVGSNNTASTATYSAVGIDGTKVGSTAVGVPVGAGFGFSAASLPYNVAVSEGFHQVNFFGGVSSGTGTYNTDSGLSLITHGLGG